MVRKRSLSSLLKEEATKATPSDASDPSIVDGELVSDDADDTDAESAVEISQNGAASAELETKVAELQRSLDQARHQEAQLQDRLSNLQTELEQQTALVQKLQTSLEKANQIQTELEKAQKVALQLADANEKLLAENAALKQANTPPVKQATKPEAAKPLPPLSQPPAAPTDDAAKKALLRQRQAAALNHPIFPNEALPSRLSEQDLGWVD